MRVVVTGANGFLGKHVVQELRGRGHTTIEAAGSKAADLRQFQQALLVVQTADVVVHVAAHVGGIGLNVTHPGQMFYDNALMGMNILEASRRAGVARVVVIGTACEYPHIVTIPTSEGELWEGYPTFETAPYAMAKKSLLVMGDAYREEYGLEVEHIIPSNLYGPHDHFDTVTGHVIPSMIAKFSRAQAEHETEVKLWGTGQATRDFLHVADAARGIAALAESGTSDGFPINLGSGRETRISLLAEIISNFYGGRAKPVFTGDVSDGVPRRLLDTGRAWRELKWRPSVRLEEGLAGTIAWYEDWDV